MTLLNYKRVENCTMAKKKFDQIGSLNSSQTKMAGTSSSLTTMMHSLGMTSIPSFIDVKSTINRKENSEKID